MLKKVDRRERKESAILAEVKGCLWFDEISF